MNDAASMEIREAPEDVPCNVDDDLVFKAAFQGVDAASEGESFRDEGAHSREIVNVSYDVFLSISSQSSQHDTRAWTERLVFENVTLHES